MKLVGVFTYWSPSGIQRQTDLTINPPLFLVSLPRAFSITIVFALQQGFLTFACFNLEAKDDPAKKTPPKKSFRYCAHKRERKKQENWFVHVIHKLRLFQNNALRLLGKLHLKMLCIPTCPLSQYLIKLLGLLSSSLSKVNNNTVL